MRNRGRYRLHPLRLRVGILFLLIGRVFFFLGFEEGPISEGRVSRVPSLRLGWV